MFVIIDDEFTKHGLTLEEAYILYRVSCFEKNGERYHESADTLAKVMGKSRRAITNYINNLVEKGYLKREYITKNTRYLSVLNADYAKIANKEKNAYAENAHHAEDEPKETNRMSDEELMAELTNGIERLKKIRMERELEND